MKAMKRKLNDILRLDAFRVGTFGATSSSSAGIRTYSFSKNDHLLVVIEENKKSLLSLVCSEESKDMVILVIGDAGLGKTTLIREVYQMIKENFNCNAWVFILPSREGLLENLWEALGLPVEPAKTKMKRLHSYLQSKSYLLVFDGIWTEDELDCIKNIVPDNNLGGRILISTRNCNFASYRARSSDCFYDLKLLTEYLSDLYLENVALHRIPKKVFKLTLLRHLSLRNTRIKSVPKSIKKLQNLRMFKLEESLVTDLPREITKLRSLLCLSVSCQGIKDVAVGVEVFLRSGCFTSLQILSLIKASYKNKSIVKELGNLTNLTELRITELKKEDGKDFCASIEMMEHLSSLDVNSAQQAMRSILIWAM
nr:disease resistance protein rpm1 [Quercus suber]